MATKDAPKLTRVRVAARPAAGIHRGGRFWPGKATDAEVTDAQLFEIEREQDLVVVRFPEAGEKAPAATNGATGEQTPPPPADGAAKKAGAPAGK